MTMNLRTPIALLVLAAATAAQATTVIYQSDVALQPTNVHTFVDLQQFDPSLGTLQSVSVTLSGEIASRIRLENKNSTPATLTATVDATVTLDLPNLGTLSVAPKVSETFNAPSYDSVVDFGGTSGITYPTATASASVIRDFLLPAQLAPFIGNGMLHATFDASATASFTGPSNNRTSVRSDAGGFALVTYTYIPSPVPEPDSWTLMAAGLGLLVWLASRRRIG